MPPLYNKKQMTRGLDGQLLGLYFFLVVIGWFAIYSSSYDPNGVNDFFDLSRNYCKQLIWIGSSMLLIIAILTIDTHLFQHYTYVAYGICLLLMVAVLLVGGTINGAKAWIKIGSFSIQPTEFMKFATALALAKFFYEGKTQTQKANQWLIASAIVFVPIVIIMLQHDAGSALVFLSFIFLFYREGMSDKILLIIAAAAVLFLLTFCLNELYALGISTALFITFWILNKNDKRKLIRNAIVFAVAILFIFSINFAFEHILEPHQKMRISTMFGKTVDPQGADFNLNQSKIAIGSGGFFGKGFLKGTQTKMKFVPERSTDFIFCSIGEEFGFFGSLVIVGSFVWLIIRILWLSERQKNSFARYYGYGVAGILFVHFAVNLGMTIGLMPIIGIPLPFISYGGSSLWSFTILLFIFIKLNDPV